MMWRRIAIGLFALMLSGCNDSQHNLHAFVSAVRSGPEAAIKPVTATSIRVPQSDFSDNQRAPFAPVAPSSGASTAPVPTIRPDGNRPPEPLEAFPLGKLAIVGTITVGNVQYALIQAPDNVVYHARTGDHAGLNYGEITAIGDHGVILSETIPNGAGGYKTRRARIPLTP